MSHELRTPLNSILILGQQLADNPTTTSHTTGRVRPTIHGAGTDLLLPDQRHPRLSRRSSRNRHGRGGGTALRGVARQGVATFKPEAESRGCRLSIDVDSHSIGAS
jgi:signal transduction histidine kinase